MALAAVTSKARQKAGHRLEHRFQSNPTSAAQPETTDRESDADGIVQVPSLHGIPECLRVIPNAIVPRHDGHQLWRLAERFRCCDVYRIERTDRFHGKRPPDAREHVVGYGNDVTAPLKPPQRTNRCAFRVKGEASGNACTNNRPRSFRKRQRRSDLPGLGPQRFQCFRVVFEERSDERTRLDVTNAEVRLSADAAGAIAVRFAREGWLLRFVTIRVNQFRSRAWRKPNVRPILRGIAGLERGPNHASRHKLVETAWTAALAGCSGGTSSATTRPCAVMAMRSPASIRRM